MEKLLLSILFSQKKKLAMERTSQKNFFLFFQPTFTEPGVSYKGLLLLTMSLKKIFSISKFCFKTSRIFWLTFLLKIEKEISDYFFFQFTRKKKKNERIFGFSKLHLC